MIEAQFGYLQEPTKLIWDAGQINPLPDHNRIIEQMQSCDRLYGGWLYPPLAPVQVESTESKKAPLMPKGFGLPDTHMISLTDKQPWTNDCANFFIALFGMLKGQRLQREEWQHFYKAPIDRKLCDFYADDREISLALNKATDFWLTHTDVETRKLAFGALHWHLFAQLYEQDFERFSAQYIALDACCKLAMATWPSFPKKCPPHAQRPSELCKHTCVPIPDWAKIPGGQKTCALAERRNALIHEGMYAGQPVGFAHPNGYEAMELELTGLVARIFLRLLGIDNEYTRSECTTRSLIGFSF